MKLGALAFSVSILAVFSLSAWGQDVSLNVGDKAPVFEALDDMGKPWKSSDHVGKKIVVVYFYPADCTGGCTKQAQGYRDDMKVLADKGVEVVGVSGDTVKNHEVFKKKENLNFTLLADTDGKVAKAFGVPYELGEKTFKTTIGNEEITLTRTATARRWTVVIGKDGKILAKNEVKAAGDDSKTILKLIDTK